jgi:hypothetical protein
MKSIVTLLAVGLICYWLYTFYQQNPDELPSIVNHQKDLVSTPIPQVKEVKVEKPVPAPDLTTIAVANGQTLTHARVKDARATSVVFVCDQGLFEISYDRLPPQFRAYYAPKGQPPAPAEDSSAAPTPSPTPTRPATVSVSRRAERTPAEDAQALASFEQQKTIYENRQKSDSDVMDSWYKQSSFKTGGITQDQFDSAKSDYDTAANQLAQLESNGP